MDDKSLSSENVKKDVIDEEFMEKLRKSGDSVGAKIIVVAENVPVGWGEPVYDRLEAEIS